MLKIPRDYFQFPNILKKEMDDLFVIFVCTVSKNASTIINFNYQKLKVVEYLIKIWPKNLDFCRCRQMFECPEGCFRLAPLPRLQEITQFNLSFYITKPYSN